MKFSTVAFVAAATAATAFPSFRRAASGPTVTVKNGTINGVHSSSYNQDFFLGIPYAQPPVDELRFRNPQSLNSTFSSTLEATQYAPECVGYGGDQIGYPVSEDCLVLNVIRPSGYEGQNLPVGVW
jgi:carboxylesterase type B